MDDEYDGGVIIKDCPHCGQYCKIPKFYRVKGNMAHEIFEADSYCKRCKKKVKLDVVFN